MSNSEDSLDLATLNELKEMLEEGLEELLDTYLDDTPRQLALLRTAVDSDDIPAINSIAHTLKGSSGNLGINGVYQLCSALEQEARSGAVADAMGSLKAIEGEFEKASEALTAFRAR